MLARCCCQNPARTSVALSAKPLGTKDFQRIKRDDAHARKENAGSIPAKMRHGPRGAWGEGHHEGRSPNLSQFRRGLRNRNIRQDEFTDMDDADQRIHNSFP